MEVSGSRSKGPHTSLVTNKVNENTTESILNKSNLENSRLSVTVPSPNPSSLKIDPIGSKVKMMKAASLFDGPKDMDMDGGVPPPNVSKPEV